MQFGQQPGSLQHLPQKGFAGFNPLLQLFSCSICLFHLFGGFQAGLSTKGNFLFQCRQSGGFPKLPFEPGGFQRGGFGLFPQGGDGFEFFLPLPGFLLHLQKLLPGFGFVLFFLL